MGNSQQKDIRCLSDIRYLILAFITLLTSCSPEYTFHKTTTLSDYPSGSGIEYTNNKLYLIGDDVNYLWIGDPEFTRTDTLRLFGTDTTKIERSTKPDLEAMTVMSAGESPSLFLLASATRPFRYNGWKVDPLTKTKTLISLDTFFNRLKIRGIDQINIEGLTAIPGGFVIANRGNKSFPKNYLIVTSKDFLTNQAGAIIKLIPVGTQKDTAAFSGVSGLDYSYTSDKLIITVSTENTYSNYEDGAIGKSYLWIINDFQTKKRAAALNPNRIIDLEELDPRFKTQKIESVCIVSEKNKKLELVLVADNDKGNSNLFRISIK